MFLFCAYAYFQLGLRWRFLVLLLTIVNLVSTEVKTEHSQHVLKS